jgi:chromosome segregation ATPase
MKKFLACVLGLALVVIIATDHLVVVKELNKLQREKGIIAQQRLDLSANQEGVVNLTFLLREADIRVKHYQECIAELQKTQKQTQEVVEHSAAVIKDLTEENANTKRELDSWKRTYDYQRETLKSVLKDREKCKEQLDKIYSKLKIREEELQYCRDAYKRATGKELPRIK